ncbi:hypothetical protein J6590_016319 [Homalodisca vitripennis]|nr:hypothetical protein J6590_016319 [Homalodisca vitripennis]
MAVDVYTTHYKKLRQVPQSRLSIRYKRTGEDASDLICSLDRKRGKMDVRNVTARPGRIFAIWDGVQTRLTIVNLSECQLPFFGAINKNLQVRKLMLIKLGKVAGADGLFPEVLKHCVSRTMAWVCLGGMKSGSVTLKIDLEHDSDLPGTVSETIQLRIVLCKHCARVSVIVYDTNKVAGTGHGEREDKGSILPRLIYVRGVANLSPKHWYNRN